MNSKGTKAVIGSSILLAVWLTFSSGVDWTALMVGAGIGVLSWATFYVSGEAIGASSTYGKIAGFLTGHLSPEQFKRFKYFRENPPRLDWGAVFFIGVLLGAFLSAYSAGNFSSRWLAPLWVERFGPDSLTLRLLTAFVGGAIMAFGARLAGGCTSGHGISGTMRLAPGSWIVFFALFLSGSITAHLLLGGVA